MMFENRDKTCSLRLAAVQVFVHMSNWPPLLSASHSLNHPHYTTANKLMVRTRKTIFGGPIFFLGASGFFLVK